MIDQVRRFNRTVTQRVGAFDDAFLSRNRPLGQARLLWEIGPDGSDVRVLRSRLDLDSGYLSRLLRALEDAARGLSYRIARLDTGPRQPHARGLYESEGYVAIGNFNSNPVATFFGEKRLSG